MASGSHTQCHTHIRRMRSVCNHHSKILQHHRIRIAHTHTHARRMRSICNHHSKILQHHTHSVTHTYVVCDPFVNCNHHFKTLQHHRIITRSHTHDACDPFVIFTPRFYNIIAMMIASSPDRTHGNESRVWWPKHHDGSVENHNMIICGDVGAQCNTSQTKILERVTKDKIRAFEVI